MPLRALLLLVPLSLLFAGGCSANRCASDADCAIGSFCSSQQICEVQCLSDLDCVAPAECEAHPGSCIGTGASCTVRGRCQDIIIPMPPDETLPGTEVQGTCEGAELPAGSGPVFVASALSIAAAGRGFNLDGRGGPDNALSFVGSFGNDLVRAGVADGTTLLLIEIVGIDPGNSDSDEVTLRFYRGIDADGDPRNNFHPHNTTPGCCEFTIDPSSVIGSRPISQACATISRGFLETRQPFSIDLTFPVGERPFPRLRFEKSRFTARVPPNLEGLNDGLLGAAVPVYSLASARNIYCRATNPQLCTVGLQNARVVELIAGLGGDQGQPDIDLDVKPDGLDCVRVNGEGHIDLCCESARGQCMSLDGRCLGATVPPLDASDPSSCTSDGRMNDGYSVALTLSAVRAEVRGVGP